MKIVNCYVFIFLFSSFASAQKPPCRQAWMATDAPAFCSWDKEPSLPEPRSFSTLAEFGSNIYVLGGFRYDAVSSQVQYYDTVVRSVIGENGRLSPWNAEPSFRTARSGAASAVSGNCLFVAGGSSSTASSLNYYDDVQYTRITADGHLSGWTTSPNHLKIPRSNLSLLAATTAQGTFLLAIAGVAQWGPDTVHLDTVEVSKIGADCVVGPWTIASYHLKGGRSTPQALLVRNNVVVIGGWGDLDLVDVYSNVETSAVRNDGSPSPWRIGSSLTTGIYGHATVLADDQQESKPLLLLSIGGQPGTGAYANWISYAYVGPGAVPDAIGSWRIAPTGKLPTGRAGLAAAAFGTRVYIIGGNDAAGTYYRDVLSAAFEFGQP